MVDVVVAVSGDRYRDRTRYFTLSVSAAQVQIYLKSLHWTIYLFIFLNNHFSAPRLGSAHRL